MKMLITLIAGLLAAQLTYAADPIQQPTNPLMVCDLNFQAVGDGFQIIGGEYNIEGTGTIQCSGQAGLTEIPVKILMNAAPINLNVAIGHIEIVGNASNVTLYTLTPEALLGDYGVTQTSFSIGMGLSSFNGTKLDHSNIVLPFSIKLIKGLGLNFGITGMTISPLELPNQN